MYDSDFVGDDSLGSCTIELQEAIENPCKWFVRDSVDIKITNKENEVTVHG